MQTYNNLSQRQVYAVKTARVLRQNNNFYISPHTRTSRIAYWASVLLVPQIALLQLIACLLSAVPARSDVTYAQRKSCRGGLGNEFVYTGSSLVKSVRCGNSITAYKSKCDAAGKPKQADVSLLDVVGAVNPAALDEYVHLNVSGNGLCGFEAYGICANLADTGTRAHWLVERVMQLDATNPDTPILEPEIAQRASKVYNAFQAYASSVNLKCWSDPDPVLSNRPGTYEWADAINIPLPGATPFVFLRVSNNSKGKDRLVHAYNIGALSAKTLPETYLILDIEAQHFTVALRKDIYSSYTAINNLAATGNDRNVVFEQLRKTVSDSYTNSVDEHYSTGYKNAKWLADKIERKPMSPLSLQLAAFKVKTTQVSTPVVTAGLANINVVPSQPHVNKPQPGVYFQNSKLVSEVYNYSYKPAFLAMAVKYLQDTWRSDLWKGPKGMSGEDQQKDLPAYNYVHPAHRTLSNVAYHSALATAPEGSTVIDIGSKYDKLEKISLKNGRKWKIVAYRPLLGSYDRTYVALHPASDHPDVEVLHVAVDKAQAGIDYLKYTDMSKVHVYANDCIWYDGVLEYCLEMSRLGAKVHISMPAYNHTLGVHKYEDEEGEYEIISDKSTGRLSVINRPAGNDVQGGYQHAVFNIDVNQGMPVIQLNSQEYILKEKLSLPLGEFRQVWFDVVVGAKSTDGDYGQGQTFHDFTHVFAESKQQKPQISAAIPVVSPIMKAEPTQDVSEIDGSTYKQVSARAFRASGSAFRYLNYLWSKFVGRDQAAEILASRCSWYVDNGQTVTITVSQEVYACCLEMMSGGIFNYSKIGTCIGGLANRLLFKKLATASNCMTLARQSLQIYQHNMSIEKDQVILQLLHSQQQEKQHILVTDTACFYQYVRIVYLMFEGYICESLILIICSCASTQTSQDIIMQLIFVVFLLYIGRAIVLIKVKAFYHSLCYDVPRIWSTISKVIKLIDYCYGTSVALWIQGYTGKFNYLSGVLLNIGFRLNIQVEGDQYYFILTSTFGLFKLISLVCRLKAEQQRQQSSTRSVLNVIGSTDMDVKSSVSQLMGGVKTISSESCRGGGVPVQTRAYHLSRDQVHKLLLRKRQCHVQKLQFFKLEGDQTKPEELDDLTPEGIYDYYARFCTCERTIATQYYPDTKDPVTDLVYKTHTFAPCPVNNVAALIARHLDTDLYPRTDVVYEYAKVIVPLMRELSKRVARDNQLFQYSIATHLQHYPEAKRNAIIHGIRSIYCGSKMVKTLKCFVKTGEWQQNDPHDFAAGKRVGRSRQIWGPSDILKAMPGWINMLYLKRAKILVPGIICGYSQDALSKKLTMDRLALCARWGMDFVKVLCYDASSHDAHQWWPLMEVVDVVLFQHINAVFDVYGIPSDVRIKVLDAITSKDFVGECFVKLGETTFKQYSITISGTTYSGHPTRTTLGNSLRTISFIVYNVYRLFGLKEAVKVFWGTSELLIVYVAGDDVMIQGQADAVVALSRALIHTHCTNVTHGSWGLGQCAREVIVGDWDFVDFLSRDGYFFEVMRVTRKTDRVVSKSNWAFNLPKVTNWKTRVGRSVLKAVRILNWSIAVQQLVWARGLSIFESMMGRRLRLGEAPTIGASIKYSEQTIRSSAMNIGTDQMDHVNQESWEEMMRRKYGATYAYFELADKGFLSHKSDFISKSLIR